MQRKARRTLHIFVVPRARRFLGHRCCAFGCHAEKNLPSGSVVSASGLSSNSQAAYTRNSGKQSYRSHGTNGANCFSLKELGGLRRMDSSLRHRVRTRQFPEKTASLSAECPVLNALLKLRHFRKVELLHLHCRNHHVKRLFSARPDGHAHGFRIRQHVNQTLIEAEIADAALHLPVLHIERTVARHTSKHFFEGLHFADVPKTRHQHSTFRRSNHLLDRLRIVHSSEYRSEEHTSE